MFTLVLGPGHGSPDPGCVNNNIVEKDYVLAFAKYLAARIEHSCEPIETHLSRPDDRNVTASQEAEITRRVKADLFFSIHVNSVGNPNPHGLLCFHKRGSYLAKEVGDAILRATPLVLMSHYRQTSISAFDRSDSLTDDYLRNAQSQLDPHDCPAVLIELGFSSNVGDAGHLKNPAVQSALVTACQAGIDHARIVLKK